MLYTTKVISPVVDLLVCSGARSATKFVSPKLVVRATIRRHRGRIPVKGPIQIILKIGRPNAREQKFVKQLLKAGVPFPAAKIRLSYPAKRKRKSR